MTGNKPTRFNIFAAGCIGGIVAFIAFISIGSLMMLGVGHAIALMPFAGTHITSLVSVMAFLFVVAGFIWLAIWIKPSLTDS